MTTKSEPIDWKETNLALFGSELEKKIKEAAAEGADEWKDVVGDTVGLYVWRIESFQVKPWPSEQYGKFHRGDSYVVLNTYQPDPKAPKLAHDVHIWIGSESTQDEYGTAAYKMVELDDKLGGVAVQHREVEEKESEKFLEYFDHKVSYLQGGIESGFHHVEPTVEIPHLYQIKGSMHLVQGTNQKPSLRMTQIPVKRNCMNSGDVFVLVASEQSVWLWIGKESNKDEKAKGVEIAKSFCTKGIVKVLEEDVNDGEEQDPEFWKYLPGKVPMLGIMKKSIHVRKADKKDDKGKLFIPKLYSIEPSGHFKLTRKAKLLPIGPSRRMQYKIPRSTLKTTGAYLLDTGFHVYIWLGNYADGDVKAVPVAMSQKYITEFRRPLLPVTVLKELMETPGFQEHFNDELEKGCSCAIL